MRYLSTFTSCKVRKSIGLINAKNMTKINLIFSELNLYYVVKNSMVEFIETSEKD